MLNADTRRRNRRCSSSWMPPTRVCKSSSDSWRRARPGKRGCNQVLLTACSTYKRYKARVPHPHPIPGLRLQRGSLKPRLRTLHPLLLELLCPLMCCSMSLAPRPRPGPLLHSEALPRPSNSLAPEGPVMVMAAWMCQRPSGRAKGRSHATSASIEVCQRRLRLRRACRPHRRAWTSCSTRAAR